MNKGWVLGLVTIYESKKRRCTKSSDKDSHVDSAHGWIRGTGPITSKMTFPNLFSGTSKNLGHLTKFTNWEPRRWLRVLPIEHIQTTVVGVLGTMTWTLTSRWLNCRTMKSMLTTTKGTPPNLSPSTVAFFQLWLKSSKFWPIVLNSRNWLQIFICDDPSWHALGYRK